MEEMRFDGQVAVVTGAGGNPSLGRAHARLLAERGAAVVVNDIGSDPEARHYPGIANAEAVAAEIRASGGQAVASTASVATLEGAQSIVDTALAAFGRIDVLVNNAGISIGAPLDVLAPRDIERHIQVNLMGTIWCSRAVWPAMKAQGYGRIVNTTSASMTGFADQAAYAASKGGIWSLTRALAAEGAAVGIRVNAISPAAYTRLVRSTLEDDSPLLAHSRTNLPAELASPGVVVLAHESCTVSGECLDIGGGQIQRCTIARNEGFTDAALTPEAIVARWPELFDDSTATTVGLASHDTADWKLRRYENG